MQKQALLSFQIGEIPVQLLSFSPEYRPRSAYYRHRHTSFELHYLFAGSCVFCAGEQRVAAQAGQLFLVVPGVYHSIAESSPELSKLCLSFELEKPPLGYQSSGSKDFAARFRGFSYALLDAGALSALFSSLRRLELKDGSFFVQQSLCASLSLLLLQLSQMLRARPEETPAQPRQEDLRAHQIDEFFNLNFHLHSGEALLAKQLGVSCRQLGRILQSRYGQSYTEKLQEIRYEIAVDLLTNTSRRIGEIAELVGYDSCANFSAFIKRRTGRTPSEIRRGRT